MTDNMDKVRFLTNPEANSVYIVHGRYSIGAGRSFIFLELNGGAYGFSIKMAS